MTYRYHIGPWVLNKGLGSPCWTGPKGAIGWMDLRSFDQFQANTQGNILVWTDVADSLSSDYRSFGEGDIRELVPKEADRSIFAELMGVQQVDGDTALDWVRSGLTIWSDPKGVFAMKPLMPSRRLDPKSGLPPLFMTIIMQGHGKLFVEPFDINGPEAATVIACKQEDYRLYREQSLDGKLIGKDGQPDEQKYLRILTDWGEQFGIASPQDVFIPADLPKEAPKPKETSYEDTLIRDDAPQLGTASSGFAWLTYTTAGVGLSLADTNVALSSHAALPIASTPTWQLPKNGSALSSSDHSVRVDIGHIVDSNSNSQVGACGRSAVTTDGTQYQSRAVYASVASVIEWRLTKQNSSGAQTDIGTNAADPANGDSQVLTCNGSTITLSVNGGASTITVTDSTISSGTDSGMFFYQSPDRSITATYFLAQDLGGGATRPVKMAGSWGGYAGESGGFAG